jgi:hypothetical protein
MVQVCVEVEVEVVELEVLRASSVVGATGACVGQGGWLSGPNYVGQLEAEICNQQIKEKR